MPLWRRLKAQRRNRLDPYRYTQLFSCFGSTSYEYTLFTLHFGSRYIKQQLRRGIEGSKILNSDLCITIWFRPPHRHSREGGNPDGLYIFENQNTLDSRLRGNDDLFCFCQNDHIWLGGSKWHEAKATPKMMKKRRHSREGGNPSVVGLTPWVLFSFLLDSSPSRE